MHPRSFLCEEAKLKQRTSLKEELCEIGEEAIWESWFESFFYRDTKFQKFDVSTNFSLRGSQNQAASKKELGAHPDSHPFFASSLRKLCFREKLFQTPCTRLEFRSICCGSIDCDLRMLSPPCARLYNNLLWHARGSTLQPPTVILKTDLRTLSPILFCSELRNCSVAYGTSKNWTYVSLP